MQRTIIDHTKPFRLISSAIAYVLIVSAVSAESAAPAFAALLKSGERSPVVVCFGDSVTGVYYHTGSRRAYTDMLEIALERESPGVDVTAINAGISGNTTVDALARIDRDVLAQKPDLVTVMFGLNDMSRVPLNEFKVNLATIIQKCTEVGAEVILCTPNSIRDTTGRPTETLERYVEAIRAVAASERTPLVDCYRAYQDVRTRGEDVWSRLMSEDIHPNMDGHKLFAETIAGAILDGTISLADVDPLPLAIPHAANRLNAGEPIAVFAMPPFDRAIAFAAEAVWPGANLTVTTWPVAGQSLAEIEAFSKTVRETKPDLVLVAVPVDARADSEESFDQSYNWILNYAVSFGHADWDCVAVPPSLAKPDLRDDERFWDADARRLIRAHDVGTIERAKGDSRDVAAIVEEWLQRQRELSERNE